MDVALATAEELCRELGSRLREHRLAQDLAQDELALRAGISLSAVKRLEKDGQAKVLTLLRAVQALGLAGDLRTLFLREPQASIAQMRRAAQAPRRRAPRRTSR